MNSAQWKPSSARVVLQGGMTGMSGQPKLKIADTDYCSLFTDLPMRARLGINTPIGQAQPLHRSAVYQVLLHYLRGIFRLHMPVPDSLGIHNDRRPVFALVQAARLVDADGISQAGGLGELLQLRVQFALSIGCARGPWSTFRTDIVAYKNVVFKQGQASLLQPSAYRAEPGANFPHLRLLTPPPSERMIP
jgi:hypothetical protein